MCNLLLNLGSARGSYVESMSGKNSKYSKGVNISSLTALDRIRYLTAMRGHKFLKARREAAMKENKFR